MCYIDRLHHCFLEFLKDRSYPCLLSTAECELPQKKKHKQKFLLLYKSGSSLQVTVTKDLGIFGLNVMSHPFLVIVKTERTQSWVQSL